MNSSKLEDHHPADIGFTFHFNYWLESKTMDNGTFALRLGEIESYHTNPRLAKYVQAEIGQYDEYINLYEQGVDELLLRFNPLTDDETLDEGDSFLVTLNVNKDELTEVVKNYWFDNKDVFFQVFEYLAKLNYQYAEINNYD